VSFTLSDSSVFATTQTRFANVATVANGTATAPSFTLRSPNAISIQALTTLPNQQRVTANIAVTYLGISAP
jgi:hypothetical protein